METIINYLHIWLILSLSALATILICCEKGIVPQRAGLITLVVITFEIIALLFLGGG